MSKFKNYRVKKFQNAKLYATGSATEIISNETQVAESSILDIGFGFVFNGNVYTKYKAFSTGFIQLLNSDIQANALDTSLTVPYPKTLWDFNTGNIDGTTLSDATGYAEGTVAGTPSSVTGIEGQAYDFDASDDTIACTQVGGADLHLMDPNNASYSFSAWVKPATNTTGYVFSKYYYRNDSQIVDRGYFLQFTDFNSADAKVNFTIYDRSTIDGVAATNIYAETTSRITNIADGNWHHIVVTVESTVGTDREVKIYIDNTAYTVDTVGEANLTTNLMSTAVHANWTTDVANNAFTLGSITGGGSLYDGIIDQLAVWENKVLTPTHVTTLYNIGNRGLSVLHDNTVYNPEILYSRNSNIRGPILAPWLGKLITWQGTYVPAEGMVDAYSLTDGIVTQLISETGVGKRKRIISFRCREHFEDTSSNGTLLNFQIVLQENTNHIEFVYDEPRQDGTPNTPLGASSGIGFSFSDYRDIYTDNYKYGGSITTQNIILNSTTGWQSNTKIKIKPYKSKTKLENKRRSQFLLDMDSDPYQYPILTSAGDQERSNPVGVTFDDRNTVFFENNVNVSYPLGIQEGHQLLNTKGASVTITGKTVKGIADSKQFLTYITHSLPTGMPPFNDTGLYEESINNSFFLTGSKITEVGEGFDASLKSKSKVVLKFPVASSTALHATLPSIAYYNKLTQTFDIKTYASATYAGTMMDPDGDGTQQIIGTEDAVDDGAFITSSLGMYRDGVIGAGQDCLLFNAFGVPVNSTAKYLFSNSIPGTGDNGENPGTQTSIFHDPSDANAEPGVYRYSLSTKLYSSSIDKLNLLSNDVVSPLKHESWSASQGQKLILTSSITEPFLLEKAIIKIPINATSGWFNDKTRALHAGFDFKSFDVGGPAVTVSLLRQDRDNLREIILSGTIVPQGDNQSYVAAGNHDGTLGILENTDFGIPASPTLDSNSRVYTNFWDASGGNYSSNKQNLASFYTTSPPFLARTDYGHAGFKSFSTPSVVVQPDASDAYDGDVVFTVKPGIVNGAYFVNTNSDIKTQGTNPGIKNSKIFQASNFGRSLDSKPSGRNLIGGEFNMPSTGALDSAFKAGQNIELTDGLFHVPANYYRFAQCESTFTNNLADPETDTFLTTEDFMSGTNGALEPADASGGGGLLKQGQFNHTIPDRDVAYFRSGSSEGLIRGAVAAGQPNYDLFSMFKQTSRSDVDNGVFNYSSLSFFIKLDSNIDSGAANSGTIIAREYNDGGVATDYGWKMQIKPGNAGHIDIQVRRASDGVFATILATTETSFPGLADSSWHHVVLTTETQGYGSGLVQVNDIRLYVDGVQYGTKQFTQTRLDTSANEQVYIAHSYDGEYGQFYMDELAYWDSAKLSQNEALEIYSASLGGLPLYKTRRGSSQVYQYLEYINSPYLLLPTDDLILAVSKTRPVRTTPISDYKNLLTGSHGFTLDQGEVEITMYGSYVSEHKQNFRGLNQHLTTPAVHHVIGNEPVLDQYDVEKTLMLSGSYIDNIITGSMVTAKKLRGTSKLQYTVPTSADNQRKVIGSNTFYDDPYFQRNISSAKDSKTKALHYDSTKDVGSKWSIADPGNKGSYHLRHRFTGSLRAQHRNAILYDTSERYYDTLLPRFQDIVEAHGLSFIKFNHASSIGALYMNHVGDTGWVDASPNFAPLNTWQHEFPFESRFSSLKRYPNPTLKFSGEGITSGSRPTSDAGKSELRHLFLYTDCMGSGSYKNWTPYRTISIWANGNDQTFSQTDNGKWTPIRYDSTEMLKILYGFGDHNGYKTDNGGQGNNVIRGNTNMPGATKYAITHANVGATIYYLNAFAPVKIRGWKYGILNASKETTKQICRRDRYGQFRDILEQRKDSKFYKNVSITRSTFENNTNTGPVQVRFVDSEGNIVEPGNTNCSNQHFEVTSSLPFFDDGADYNRFRNRGPLPPQVDARTISQLLNFTSTSS